MSQRNFTLTFFLIIFCGIINCYSQGDFRTVKFEMYFDRNEPIPAGNLVVLGSKPTIGTQTDLKGKAELNLPNKNIQIVLDYLGPQYIKFNVVENADLIIVNIKKKKIYYSRKNKVFKKTKLNIGKY